MHRGALADVGLAPGLSTLTLVPEGSCEGQRPLGAYATPGGTASLISTAIRSAPVALRSVTASPLRSPRPAASRGCSATVAGPMRLRSLPSLPKVAFMSQGEAGESRRSQPGGGASSALGSGRRGWPSASARRRDLDTAARRREAVCELDARLGEEAHRARTGELVPGDARGREQALDQRLVALLQCRLREAHVAARRRKISALRSASPGGSAALTWAESVWWKYDATMSSLSRNPAAGST